MQVTPKEPVVVAAVPCRPVYATFKLLGAVLKMQADVKVALTVNVLATDAASVGVWDWDITKADQWYATPTYFTMLGYDPEEVTGFAFGLGVERVCARKYQVTTGELLGRSRRSLDHGLQLRLRDLDLVQRIADEPFEAVADQVLHPGR